MPAVDSWLIHHIRWDDSEPFDYHLSFVVKSWFNLCEAYAYDTNDTVFKRDIPFRDTIFHSKGSESIIFLVVDNFIFETFVEDDAPHDLIASVKENTVLVTCRGTFIKH